MNKENSGISLRHGAAKLISAAAILFTVIVFASPLNVNAAVIVLGSNTDSLSQYTGVSYSELNNYFLNEDHGYLSMGYFATGDNAVGVFTKSMSTDLSAFTNSEISFNFQVFVGNSSYNNFSFSLRNGPVDGPTQSSTFGVNLSSTGLNIDSAFHTLTFQVVDGALTASGATLDGTAISSSFLSSSTTSGFSLADFTSWQLVVGGSYFTDMGVNIDTITMQTVPEPGSLALFLGGGAMLLTILRRRHRTVSIRA